MARWSSRAWCVLAIGLLASPAAASDFARVYVSPADGVERPYDVRTPAGYNGTTKLPAVLFLHGRGGSRFSFRLPSYEAELDARGFVGIFWQGRPADVHGLYSTYYIDTANGFPDETDVLACLDDALAHFAIDPDRVHLAGFSQGGKGALLVGLENPDRFASIAEGAGPSDAFEGQLWSPTFPDYRDAAGGGYVGSSPAVLARWFAQSPRFLLPAARNVPIALFHGSFDDNVPDDGVRFPYRNTHHIADTPGFSDARGRAPTLLELHASDPGGYVFETHYPPVGHDEEACLQAPLLFSFFSGRVRAAHPARVVAVTYDARQRRSYWTSLARLSPPDGTPAGLDASTDAGRNRMTLRVTGNAAVTLDLSVAGLDPSRSISIEAAGGSLSLKLLGGFGSAVRVLRDGVVLRAGFDYGVDAGSLLLLPFDPGAGTLLVIEPPAAELAESDLLVPVFVQAPGVNGASFSSELILANVSPEPLDVEILLLDGSGARTGLTLSPRATSALSSSALLPIFGRDSSAVPMRLRVLGGSRAALLATVRVFNVPPSGGSYGFSFSARPAGDSLLAAGETASLFADAPGRDSRFNLSLFSPFEASSALVTCRGADGAPLKSIRVSVDPLRRIQLNGLTADAPATARLDVEVTEGRLQVYGTPVSNLPTNDAFLSAPLKAADADREWTVPAVVAAPGRFGAAFTSDLFLDAPSSASAVTVGLTYHSREGGAASAATLILGPGETRALSDAVAELFPREVPGAGALEIRADDPVRAFAVTRSDSPGGPASQDLPAVPGGSEITDGAPAAFTGVSETLGARSNLILYNRGAATNVALTLFAEDGDRGSLTVSLEAGEVRQIDSFSDLFGRRPASAATLLVAPAPGGRVVAAVSRLDNLTNDPTGLAPIPLQTPF